MNDITPPKPTKSKEPTVEPTQPTKAATNVAAPTVSRTPDTRLKLLAIGVLALVAILAGWYLWSSRNNPPSGVYADVNGQQETTKDFNELKSARIKFAQSGSTKAKVDPKAVEKSVADEVILRLALQDEAKKQGKLDCSQAKVDERLAERYKDAGGREAFYGQLQSLYGWTEQVSAHQECLDYYETSMQDSLIGGYKLFGVYVRWDIALGMDASAKAEIERKAQDKLKNTFLPMFEQGATDDQIEAKADVNGNTSTADFDQRVISTSDPASRILRVPRFNQDTYSSFQQYDEGDNETDYVYKLSEGEHTPVFKSKTGYYIIYRADKKFAGKYVSYDAMLTSAQKTAKISKSYYALPAVKTTKPKPSEGVRAVSFLSGLMTRALHAITPSAEAADVAPNSVRCFTGTHALPFTVEYRDKDTGSIISTSGTSAGAINIKSTGDVQTPCNDEPAAGSGYGVTISYPGGGIVNYAVSGHPNPWDFSLSCYTSWQFRFGAPTGYNELSSSDYSVASRFNLSLVYDGGAYSGDTASETAGVYQIPSKYYSTLANGVKGFIIKVYFTKSRGGIWSLASTWDTATGSYNKPSADNLNNFPDDVDTEAERSKFFCISGSGCGSDKSSGSPPHAVPTYLKTGLLAGVYTASLGNTSWSVQKVTVQYLNACGPHKVGIETFTNIPSADVRVCGGQTQVVTFYLKKTDDAPTYNPWLQTKDGNVLAFGSIEGQLIGGLAGRPSGATDKEAEYVVMGYSIRNFCSTNGYGLGGAGCTYDPGYYVNYDNGSLGTANDPVLVQTKKLITGNSPVSGLCSRANPYIVKGSDDTQDLLRSSVKDSNTNYSSFGANSSCAVVGNLSVGHDNSDEFEAKSHVFTQGRATIYIKPTGGILHITKDQIIQYASGGYGSINEIPNVGLVVEGDVEIHPSVRELDMSIYATGAIKTCAYTGLALVNYPSPWCRNPLVVRGMLAAAKGFQFGRNYFDTGSRGPAELIVGSGLIDAFPPPGLVDITSKSATGVRYITTEGNPRF